MVSSRIVQVLFGCGGKENDSASDASFVQRLKKFPERCREDNNEMTNARANVLSFDCGSRSPR